MNDRSNFVTAASNNAKYRIAQRYEKSVKEGTNTEKDDEVQDSIKQGKYSREQIIFIDTQITLDQLDTQIRDIRKRREETGDKLLDAAIYMKLENTRNNLREMLWLLVREYIISLINKRCRYFHVSDDKKGELVNEAAATFVIKLPLYDPTWSAPTTYFTRVFTEEIDRWIRHEIPGNPTQNMFRNIRKVSHARNELLQMDIAPTPEVIADRAGMSVKVVKDTISFMNETATESIDECVNMAGNLPSPESVYIDEEFRKACWEATKHLSDEEWTMFWRYYKMPPDYRDTGIDADVPQLSREECTYKGIAKELGETPKRVKSVLTNARKKLLHDPALIPYLGVVQDTPKKETGKYYTREGSAAAMQEDQYMRAISIGMFGPQAAGGNSDGENSSGDDLPLMMVAFR